MSSDRDRADEQATPGSSSSGLSGGRQPWSRIGRKATTRTPAISRPGLSDSTPARQSPLRHSPLVNPIGRPADSTTPRHEHGDLHTPGSRAHIAKKTKGPRFKNTNFVIKTASPISVLKPFEHIPIATSFRGHGQVHGNSQNRAPNSRASFPLAAKITSALGRNTHRPVARISSQFKAPTPQDFRRHSSTNMPIPASTKPQVIMTTKATTPIAPLWQDLDDEFEARKSSKRGRDDDGLGQTFAKRVSSTTNRRNAMNKEANDFDVIDMDRPKAAVHPGLKLRGVDEPEDSNSDDDEPRYRPQPKVLGRKTSSRPQIAAKKSAARKVEYTNATSSEEESEKMPTSSSDDDQLDSDQYDPVRADRNVQEDVNMEEATQYLPPPANVVLNSQPTITIPLPQIDQSLVENREAIQSTDPSADLVAAVEMLTLSTLRMHKTRQLPFMVRTLRQGFLQRCRELQIPIYSDDRRPTVSVHYDYVAGISYETEVSKWLCPLCELMGDFTTREMLDCHLRWDHQEVYTEWVQTDETDESEEWSLQLLIPEILESEPESSFARDRQSLSKHEEEGTSDHGWLAHGETTLQTPPSRGHFDLFPSVTLSPSLSRRRETSPSPLAKFEVTPVPRTGKVESSAPASTTASSSRPSVTNSISSRWRSTTGASISTATTQRPAHAGRYPTPPPPDNPLGPAAQPPYLPAESDYGGPTVHYSCRPGGACLFDLLNTLPMDKFGVLDWEILDREEEIYESDDVKEEYKVMHALWARWIILNRPKFISNYHKGLIAFVNEYWKIIHRAAGWDALRYWLLMLLANQFLTGHEVAQVLVHYENLTGMAHWYD
ncbi:hypothetical protein B0H34DRAFT_710695 [Crassisporium funariophilum]|nr:hypothetical protein B0H34DRAFT_710695 [Crassisporium funariophilum]